jgi:hypothetical protein
MCPVKSVTHVPGCTEGCEKFCMAVTSAIRGSVFWPVCPPIVVWAKWEPGMAAWDARNVIRLAACLPGLRGSAMFRRAALTWIRRHGVDALLGLCAAIDLGQVGMSVLPLHPSIIESLQVTDAREVASAVRAASNALKSSGALLWSARFGLQPTQLPASLDHVGDFAVCAWRQGWVDLVRQAIECDGRIVDRLRRLCGVADATGSELLRWCSDRAVSEDIRRRVRVSKAGDEWGAAAILAGVWRDSEALRMVKECEDCVLAYRFYNEVEPDACQEDVARIVLNGVLSEANRGVPEVAWQCVFRVSSAVEDRPDGADVAAGGVWSWEDMMLHAWKCRNVSWSETTRRWHIAVVDGLW